MLFLYLFFLDVLLSFLWYQKFWGLSSTLAVNTWHRKEANLEASVNSVVGVWDRSGHVRWVCTRLRMYLEVQIHSLLPTSSLSKLDPWGPACPPSLLCTWLCNHLVPGVMSCVARWGIFQGPAVLHDLIETDFPLALLGGVLFVPHHPWTAQTVLLF